LRKERRHFPPTTAAAGKQKKKCGGRRSHREHPKTLLEGCSFLPSLSPLYHSLQLSEAKQSQLEEAASGSETPKLGCKERGQPVPAPIVNSKPQDKAFGELAVVQQIIKELKCAVSEEDMVLDITKIVITLLKEDGK
jgi:hypothetical protein